MPSTFPPKKFASAVSSSWCTPQIGLGFFLKSVKPPWGSFCCSCHDPPSFPCYWFYFGVFFWRGGFPELWYLVTLDCSLAPNEPHLLDNNFYIDSGLIHLTRFGKWDIGQGHGSRGLRGVVQWGMFSWNTAASTREEIWLSCWKGHVEGNWSTLTSLQPCEQGHLGPSSPAEPLVDGNHMSDQARSAELDPAPYRSEISKLASTCGPNLTHHLFFVRPKTSE